MVIYINNFIFYISSFIQNWPIYNLQGLHSVHTLLQGLLSIYMHPFARAFFSTPFGKGSLKNPFCKGLPFPKGLPFYKSYHSWLKPFCKGSLWMLTLSQGLKGPRVKGNCSPAPVSFARLPLCQSCPFARTS